MAPRPTPSPDQLVTSSDLVRHFGLWQERATRAPLYILHRGRPRFVLTSIETMEALCAPYASGDASAARTIDPTTLLDSTSDLVLVADEDGAIVATSRAARAHFGAIASSGAPIDAIAPVGARALLHEAIDRVIAWGIGDRVEIPSAARAGRTLLLTIEPARRGVAVIAQDGTAERDHATAHALTIAMQAATGVASVTINLRGYVTTPTPALTTLTKLEPAALTRVPFVELAPVDARNALGIVLEQAMAGETPPALQLTLQETGASSIPITVGLAPIRSGSAIVGVAAVLVSR